jgi:hypothetical protein
LALRGAANLAQSCALIALAFHAARVAAKSAQRCGFSEKKPLRCA